MIIDWTQAPIGTTHATINGGEPRWYKLEDGKVFCWGIRIKEWAPSFFLTVDEIAETGLHLYANGEQSEMVMLRLQHEALMEAAKRAISECNRGPSGRLILEDGDEEALRKAINLVGNP